MKCPLCDIAMAISTTTMEVEGDTSAQEKTRVYRVQHLICRNRQCKGFGKEQRLVKQEMYRSE